MGLAAFGQFAQFRRHLGQPQTLHPLRVESEQLAGAVVDRRDPPHPVQADHPRADAGQDGLDEQAASLRLVRGGLQRGLLRLDVLGHAVEGLRQDDQFGRRAGVVDARVQVAARHLIRRLHQPPDRGRDRTGRRHGQPDGADQDQQSRLQIAQSKGRLDARPALLGGAIGGDGLLAVTHPLDQAGRQRPHDIEIGAAVIRQGIERSHHVRVFGHGRRGHLPAGHRLERFARRGHIGRRARPLAAGQDPALVIQYVKGRIAEEVADLRQGARELDAAVEQVAHAAQFGRHGLQVHLQPSPDVGDVGAADLGAVLDGRADVGAEPLVHAPVDQDAEHQGDQHRRHDRNQGEEGDEPKMQSRARIVAVARQP
ncbi:hypothetical protein D3C73_456720 [compost metagenome]